MAKATEEQVKALEIAHKQLFIGLVEAAILLRTLSQNFSYLPDTDPKKKAVLNYTDMLVNSIGGWIARQNQLSESGGTDDFNNISPGNFFNASKIAELKVLADNIKNTL